MHMALRLLKLSIFSLLLVSGVLEAAPTTKHVELKEFTQMSLEIVPDYGTLLVFPFILDDSNPPFTISNTNKLAFEAKHDKGQYTVLVTAKTPEQGGFVPQYGGFLYITTMGYTITIELKSTNRKSKNYANVIFDVTDDQREYLISEAVKRRTESLEKAFKEKEAKLDRLAEEKALEVVGQLVRSRPDTRNIKADKDVNLPPNVTLSLFANRWHVYDHFAILSFEIDNRSPSAVAVSDVQLVTASEDGQTHSVSTSVHECNADRVAGDDSIKCTLSTLDMAALDAEELRLVVVTDRGEAVLTW